MKQQNNVAVVRAYYDAFNRREIDRALTLVDDALEWINVAFGVTYRGPAGFRQFLDNYATAFPDSKVELRNVVADGDRVAIEFDASGTHTGPLDGPAGMIAPTGRRIRMQLCEFLHLRDGRIVRGTSYYDAAAMLRQLGIRPDTTPATV